MQDQEEGHAADGHRHRGDAQVAEAIGQGPDGQEARHHPGGDPEEMIGHRQPLKPADIAQIGARPQALNRHVGAHDQQADGGQAPEDPVGVDPDQPAQLFAPGATMTGGGMIRHHQPQHPRQHQGQNRQAAKDPAPGGQAQGQFHRGRGHERPQAAKGHDPAIHRRQPLGGEPHDEGLETGHEAGGYPQPDQGPAQDQFLDPLADREKGGAGGGEQQQQGLHPLGRETVQQDPQRQLEGGEGEEIDAGQQPQGGGVEVQVGHQFRGQHRIDGAVEVGEEIAGGERQEDPQPQHPGGGSGTGPAAGGVIGGSAGGHAVWTAARHQKRSSIGRGAPLGSPPDPLPDRVLGRS